MAAPDAGELAQVAGAGRVVDGADDEEQARLEQRVTEDQGDAGEGGTVSFQNSGKEHEAEPGTTVLEAGEAAGVGMPYGCRMGICHTCTRKKISGPVKNLITGAVSTAPDENIEICVTAPCGDVQIDL